MHDVYRHEALPYAGETAFPHACASAIREGLERDERVLLLAADAKLDDVRDELGDDAAEVTLVGIDEHGRNPSRITTMLHSFQAAGDGRRSLGLNETVRVDRSSAVRDEAYLSESLLNHDSLRTWALSVICLYDRSTLDEDALCRVHRTHAVVHGMDTDGYEPYLSENLFATALRPPPSSAARLTVTAAKLGDMRVFVRERTAGFGVSAERVDDLVLAANEIVTNSLRHGGGSAWMALWFAEGAVVCEVCDDGFLRDPMAGRVAPPPAATSGRGLWLANHLCDLVQIRSSPAGTTVRLHVDR